VREGRDAQAAMLAALGRLWLANVAIDWNGFYAEETRRRVALPTYPYERKRHWIDPPNGPRGRVAAGAATALPIERWFHAPSWRRQPRLNAAAVPPAAAQTRLVFCDSRLGAALADALQARGEGVFRVHAGDAPEFAADHAVLRAAEPADYVALIEHLAARQLVCGRIEHTWTVASAGDDYALAQAQGYYSLLYLLQALGERGDTATVRLDVISTGLADVTGVEALDPLKASVLGPVLVAPREYPGLVCRHIDVLPDSGAAALLAELDADDADTTRIALRGAHRWALGYEAVELPPTDDGQPWREGGTYLITGGLGGLGLVFARELAQRWRARLVLTGRQGLPPRAEWENWLAQHGADDATSRRIRAVQELEASGAEVLVAAVDVTDAAAMSETV
ncbi:MAG: KR domain-containing protein, partial [Xanthomonadaceae bacterium]|nr:KR domain-containing protein [Xanthomonadaceae bacterium]